MLRFRSELSRNDTLIKTRYYAPGYEKTITADSTRENYYIVSPPDLAALIVEQDTASRIYYAEQIFWVHPSGTGSVPISVSGGAGLHQSFATSAIPVVS